MTKGRLEAFSDGVIAIIITIMVLEIKVPHGHEWPDLKPLLPAFISYIISFLTVGIYWGNHHHLLHAMKYSTGKIILANLHLLFWLSLLPFATTWMGENHFAPNTITVYAVIFMCCGFAWSLLDYQVMKQLPPESEIRMAIRKLFPKSLFSTSCALAAIPLGYIYPIASGVLFFVQSMIWLIPDRRVEAALKNMHEEQHKSQYK